MTNSAALEHIAIAKGLFISIAISKAVFDFHNRQVCNGYSRDYQRRQWDAYDFKITELTRKGK